jgi:hypothetical protein
MTPTGRHEKKRGLPMHVERSGSPLVGGVAAIRSALSAAGAMLRAGAESLASYLRAAAGTNSVARDGARSAYSLAGDIPAVIGAQRPKGQIGHVSSHPLASRRRACAGHCHDRSATATARGRGAALVRQDELDLRSGAYSPTAMRASRAVYPFHSSTVGKVAGGQHRDVGCRRRAGAGGNHE